MRQIKMTWNEVMAHIQIGTPMEKSMPDDNIAIELLNVYHKNFQPMNIHFVEER